MRKSVRGPEPTYDEASEEYTMNRTVQGVAAALYGMISFSRNERRKNDRVIDIGDEMRIFDKQEPSPQSDSVKGQRDDRIKESPRFVDIYEYLHYIFRRAQVEPECLIAALVYTTKLIAIVPRMALTEQNWERVIFVCVMVASKVWDDLSCSSRSFSVCSNGTVGIKELNRMERVVLRVLDFRLLVTADTYRMVYYSLKRIWTNMHVDKEGRIVPVPFEMVSTLDIPREWGTQYIFCCKHFCWKKRLELDECKDSDLEPESTKSMGEKTEMGKKKGRGMGREDDKDSNDECKEENSGGITEKEDSDARSKEEYEEEEDFSTGNVCVWEEGAGIGEFETREKRKGSGRGDKRRTRSGESRVGGGAKERIIRRRIPLPLSSPYPSSYSCLTQHPGWAHRAQQGEGMCVSVRRIRDVYV